MLFMIPMPNLPWHLPNANNHMLGPCTVSKSNPIRIRALDGGMSFAHIAKHLDEEM